MNKRVFRVMLVVLSVLVLGQSALAQVTLQFMGWEASPLETESVQRGLRIFEEQNPGIKVEYIPVGGDEYHTRLLTMMAGNAAPDVFFINTEGYYRNFARRGVLLELDDYFYQALKLEDFIPMDQDKMLVDGKIYGTSSCVVAPVLYYNKDLFDKAGLPYPPSNPEEAWTWDEFLEIAKQLTIEENGRVVQWGVYGFENMHPREAAIYSNNGLIFSEDYSQVAMNAEAQEALTKILELRTVHKVSPPATFLEQSGMNAAQMLQTGRVAMVADGSWALQELARMGFPVGVGVLPIMQRPVTTGTAHLHSIWAGTKHPEEAWKLVEFLSSEEYQIDLVREGLWMPNRTHMYAEENRGRWINPEVHPEGFEGIADYFANYVEPNPAIFVPREAWDIFEEELDRFFLDNQPLDKVVQDMIRRIDPILK
ncbi:MAG: sugar ABC transporter substrate-binding protein [Eubacteriales bacterium]|jgi:multiple sugar transport system substrate-binding protein